MFAPDVVAPARNHSCTSSTCCFKGFGDDMSVVKKTRAISTESVAQTVLFVTKSGDPVVLTVPCNPMRPPILDCLDEQSAYAVREMMSPLA